MADNDIGLVTDIAIININGIKVDNVRPPKRVVNWYMSPPFQDFRQYMSNYYLFLPFVGIINLDAVRYIGHTLSIDLIYDPRTSNLKYNIMSDGVLMQSHEGSVRVNCPVTAASPMAAARSKLAGAEEALGGMVTAGAGAMGMNGGAILGGLSSAGAGLSEILRPIPKKSTGGFTSSTSVYDSLHIYLMIETPEIYYGDGIIERYGLPDNRYTKIGNLSGYVELTDVDLHVAAADAELDEIRALLSNGVVI